MRFLDDSTEHDMVATFLREEFKSQRWHDKILDLVRHHGLDQRVVEAPNLQDPAENTARARLLGDFRGYGQGRSLFMKYPDPSRIQWKRVAVDRATLASVRYIDYSYWNVLSGGTRLPSVAAENIKRGLQSCGVPNEGFWEAARALERGVRFPGPILVAPVDTDVNRVAASLIVLEGHMRLTAYLLAPEHIPDEVIALLGMAPEFESW